MERAPVRMHAYSDAMVAMVCFEMSRGLVKAQHLIARGGTGALPAGPFIAQHPDLLEASVHAVAEARLGATSAREYHTRWTEFLAARGWSPGAYSEARKTHPALVPWSELPPGQRDKARVAVGIIMNMTIDAEIG